MEKICLQVHYNIMKESLLHYNDDARTRYFSEHIYGHLHKPRSFFFTIDYLLNLAPHYASVESDAECELLLYYFTDKVESIRASNTPNAPLTLMSLMHNKIA